MTSAKLPSTRPPLTWGYLDSRAVRVRRLETFVVSRGAKSLLSVRGLSTDNSPVVMPQDVPGMRGPVDEHGLDRRQRNRAKHALTSRTKASGCSKAAK
jgi:hypothetical protein